MSFDLKLQKGDLAIGSNGDLAIVENNEKLTQDILKIVSTPLGSNRRFPWYGSPISKGLVGTAFETQFVQGIMSQQLQTALETLQRTQETQLAEGQVVTAQEQIAAVSNVAVNRNEIDPRFFSVALTVVNKAFQQNKIRLGIGL